MSPLDQMLVGRHQKYGYSHIACREADIALGSMQLADIALVFMQLGP